MENCGILKTAVIKRLQLKETSKSVYIRMKLINAISPKLAGVVTTNRECD